MLEVQGRHNFAVEQTAGSHSLTRGCSPRRSPHRRNFAAPLAAAASRLEGHR